MGSTHNIIGIDSSTSVLRVGLSRPDGQIVSRENRDRYRHAEFIFELIDSILKGDSVEKSAIGAVVVSTGPGSFTGLRVGMSAAKGLAVSLKIPIVGITTYAAIARRLLKEIGRAAVLVPSRRDEYYFGLIEKTEFREEKIRILKTNQILQASGRLPVFAVDFDADRLKLPDLNVISADNFSVKIEDFIRCGEKKLAGRGGDNLSLLEPFYVLNFPAGKEK